MFGGRFCSGTTESIGIARDTWQHPHALRWHESPGGGATLITPQSELERHSAIGADFGTASHWPPRHAATNCDASATGAQRTAAQLGRAQSITAQRAASLTPRGTACGSLAQQLPQHPSKVLSTHCASAVH